MESPVEATQSGPRLSNIMAITYKRLFLMSAAASVLLTRLGPEYAPFSGTLANFWVILLPVLTVMFVSKTFIYPRLLSPLRDLPMPSGGSWLLGQFPYIIREPSGEPFRDWQQNVPNNGLIRYLHIFNTERVFLASPKALAEVLVTKNYEFIKPSFFRHNLGRLLGIGILFAEGDEHKRQRKLLMPAFGFRHIKELYPTFWSKARECAEAMTKATQKPEESVEEIDPSIINVQNWASRVTLDIIGVAGMGHDFNSISDPNSEINKSYRKVFELGGPARFVQFLGFILPQWILTKLPLKRNQEIMAARKTIIKVCRDLIENKRNKMEKGLVDRDIISVALESGGFTNEDLVNQLMTFLAAGHETTASAMAWACYHLCRHPEVQARLRKEIREHLPSISDSNATVTAADVDKLPYLSAVCNEVLRVYPSVPLTIRVAERDSSILGHFIPKGTHVVITAWAINVNKELWGPDAEEFNPDRWMGPGRANPGGADSNYSFLTFLHGPRSCIGQQFAKAEFACILATWVGRFEMEFANKDYVLDIGGGVTSKPKGGLKCRFTPVEGW